MMKTIRLSNCRGLTLIELMISIVIGVLVLLIATGMIKSSISNRGVVRNMSDLQTQSYFFSSSIYQQLTQIGYRHIDHDSVDDRLLPIATYDQAFPAQSDVWADGQVVHATADSLWYRFDGASTSEGDADGSIFDCLGNSLPSGSTYEARLSLSDNQLLCTVGTDTAVLVGESDGISVEQLNITLGVDTDDDGNVDSQIDASTASGADFLGTQQITLRMLLASRDYVTDAQQTYHYNDSEIVASDNRLRTEAVVSVAIRN